jgi:hypothetical protein
VKGIDNDTVEDIKSRPIPIASGFFSGAASLISFMKDDPLPSFERKLRMSAGEGLLGEEGGVLLELVLELELEFAFVD